METNIADGKSELSEQYKCLRQIEGDDDDGSED